MIESAALTAWASQLPHYGLIIGEAAVIAVLGWFAASMISKAVARGVLRSGNITLARFLKQFIFYICMLFVLFAICARLGVSTTSLAAILAGMSLAVGLSLRDSLSNLASGILLVIFKPFRVNDAITLGAWSGTVHSIELLFTYLVDESGAMTAIPNNKFMTGAVTKNKKH